MKNLLLILCLLPCFASAQNTVKLPEQTSQTRSQLPTGLAYRGLEIFNVTLQATEVYDGTSWYTLGGKSPMTASAYITAGVTQQQRDAISNPVRSMMVYNLTTDKWNFWNGINWQEISSILAPAH